MVIVFGIENPIFFAKSDIFISKCTEGGWGSTGLGNIPENTKKERSPSKIGSCKNFEVLPPELVVPQPDTTAWEEKRFFLQKH